MNKVFLDKYGTDNAYYTIDVAIDKTHFDGHIGYYSQSSAMRAAKSLAIKLNAQLVINFGNGKRIKHYEHN